MPRVLIVDDSPTARELIAGILGHDPEIEIIGQATNGEEAVRMTQELRPDVLTVDIHMPLMSGLEATQKIMSTCPTPIVIVSASTLVHDVEWAMNALQLGALTLLLKPPGPDAANYDAAARELVETVKAMAGVKVVGRRPREAAPAKRPQLAPVATATPRAIAIAASTGGPPAIQQVLRELPADFPAPILVVQHIASGFTEGFVSWLDTALPLRVKAAEQNERLRPGVVYVAPEDRHLGAAGSGCVALSSDEPIGGFRPSATFLFDSVGRVYKEASVGIILTGMGSDGVEGLKILRAEGGHVIAQDEASCVVYGMPGAAKQAGVVDASVSLDRIAAIIQAT
jgi:two-component system chemotaxis response regulator CheB